MKLRVGSYFINRRGEVVKITLAIGNRHSDMAWQGVLTDDEGIQRRRTYTRTGDFISPLIQHQQDLVAYAELPIPPASVRRPEQCLG